MARQVRTRLDRKGLAALGPDKLVEILLEESVSNKALRARLETALAGTAGPAEVARAIGKQLDAHEKARTAINRPRARDLTVELAGLLRTIQSELAGSDAFSAFEDLMRLRGLRENVERRLKADSAKLMNVFSDAEAAAAEIALALPESGQIRAVPILERARQRDRYLEHVEFFAGVLGAMAAPAAAAWQGLLEAQLATAENAPYAARLLQRLFLQNGNLDGFVALESAKPENRQDTLLIARNLMKAKRLDEALAWVRKVFAGKRLLSVNGILVSVDPDYERHERRLLEADILDGLKQREASQALRWNVFLETFDKDVLRRYIARLDDFAEFDELDKAFAAVRASEDIHKALKFLVEWPKLDQAAEHVVANSRKWDGRNYEILVPAADALSDDYPVAATLLYRALINHILEHAIANAYEHAARYLRVLAALSLRLPANVPFEDHAAFVSGLMNRHPRKYGFWQRLSGPAT